MLNVEPQLVYTILFLIGSAVLSYLWFYLQRNQEVPAVRIYSYLILNSLGIMTLQFLELTADAFALKIFFLNARFVLYTFFPPLMLLFVLRYTGKHDAWITRYGRLLWIEPALIGLLVLSNPLHELFRANYQFIPHPLFPGELQLRFDRGPFQTLHLIYANSIGIYILYVWVTAWRERIIRSAQLITTLAATAIPLSTEALFSNGVTVFNFGPISNAAMAFVYWVGLFRYRLFDPKPIARSIILDQIGDAMMVVDQQGRIIDVNPAARQLLPIAAPVGAPLETLIPQWPAWQAALAEHAAFQAERVWTIQGRQVHYAVKITALHDPQGDQLGWVLLFQNISLQKANEAQQAQLAAFEERERIGRDLHDDLGQVLGYVNVQTQAALTLLSRSHVEQAQLELSRLVEVTQTSQRDLRRYILGLRAGEEADIAPLSNPTDFLTTLNHYLDTLYRQYDFSVDLHLPDDLPDHMLPPASELQLLRVIQEALTNARKHAGVRQAQIYLALEAAALRVVISDRGRGFNAAAPIQEPTPELHFGLQMMQERIALINGKLTVKSAPGAGTTIAVSVPRLLQATPETPGWRVLLVDDHALFSEGLRTLLTVRGLNVVGIAHNGLEAQTQARALLPDLILMDIDMPVCNGVEATQRIKAELPDMRIVMLTVSADDATLFSALRAGASGYLLKDLSDDEFFRLLKGIMRGESVLAPSLVPRILAEFATQPAEPQAAPAGAADAEQAAVLAQLSARQLEVLQGIAEGLTYKEVADQLHLSERTVRYHMGQIITTLQAKNRREAVALLRRHRQSGGLRLREANEPTE